MHFLFDVTDDPDVFVYTNQGGSPTVESIDDEDDFCNLRDALALMGNVSWRIICTQNHRRLISDTQLKGKR